MSQAQIKTYKDNKSKFVPIKKRILNEIMKGDANEYQIEARMSILRCTAMGRLSDLQDDGTIYVISKFNNGKNSTYSYEPCIAMQKKRASERLQKKYTKWLKLAKKHNFKLENNE